MNSKARLESQDGSRWSTGCRALREYYVWRRGGTVGEQVVALCGQTLRGESDSCSTLPPEKTRTRCRRLVSRRSAPAPSEPRFCGSPARAAGAVRGDAV